MKIPPFAIRLLPLAIAAALTASASGQAPVGNSMQQAEGFYRQGMAAEQAGDPAAARLAYLNALKTNPRHANARYSLGQLKIYSSSIAAKGREAKFGTVLVPEFKLDQATLKEALDALQLVVEKQSKEEVTPSFILQDRNNALANARITLVLKNTPARGVLRYLLEQAGAKARYDEHAIVIMPK